MAIRRGRTLGLSYLLGPGLGLACGVCVSMALAAIASPERADADLVADDPSVLETSPLACGGFQALGAPLPNLGSVSLLEKAAEAHASSANGESEDASVSDREIVAVRIDRDGREPEIAWLSRAEGGGFVAGRLYVEIFSEDGRAFASLTSLDEPLVHASCGLAPSI